MNLNVTIYQQSVGALLAAQKKLLFEYPVEKVWNRDGVTLHGRVQHNKQLGRRIKNVLTPANIAGYIVPASEEAPTRCIDGRITQGWNSMVAVQKSLGPKIAGGTAHAALTHRIVDVGNLTQHLRFEEDIRYVIQQYKQIGIGFGGHIDDHQHGSNTGCGAVDNINLILERLQRPEPQEQLRGLTKVILGYAFNTAIVNEMIGRMLYLDALKPRYMPKENNDPKGEFLYKKTIVETIRHEAEKSEEPVPALAGTHNEVAIVLNFVPGTTIDTDRFSYDNNNELQIFGWDIWEMYEEARYLYKYNMYESTDLQRSAIENRLKHITTRTLLGLATTMVLTDGSLHLITVHKPAA
jgi:hypothetical protein